MLYARFTTAAAALAYRNALDAAWGFPISEDPLDQHFADVVPNVAAAANPSAEGAAWGLDISCAFQLASDPTQTLLALEMTAIVPFPEGATTFDWDTTNAEWVVQTTGPGLDPSP